MTDALMSWSLALADEHATVRFGRLLGALLTDPIVIFLEGELGAGKTTLTRGVLRSMHYEGAVKSPTYTLVEPYELPDRSLYHFDLYRLSDPEELEYLGFRDYLDAAAVVLVEWPSRGAGLLPLPDLRVQLSITGSERKAEVLGYSERGCEIIASLRQSTARAEF